MTRLTPMRAIRAYCVWCHNHQQALTKECPSIECDLYSRRMGREDKSVEVEYRLTTLKAIKFKCLDCSSRSASAVNRCDRVDCRLHEYRTGKNKSFANRKAPSMGAEVLQRYRKSNSG